jgi:hypothetical protein
MLGLGMNPMSPEVLAWPLLPPLSQANFLFLFCSFSTDQNLIRTLATWIQFRGKVHES